MVSRLNWGKGRKFGLRGLSWCFAPSRGLHHLQQAGPLFSLDSHVWWDGNLFLSMICLYREGSPGSPTGASRDRGWLKTSKSSSKLDTSTILSSSSSFSSLMTGWEGKAPTFGRPSSMGVVTWMPSGTGPVVKKPKAATLIWCRRGSFALVTHLGAWKALEIGSKPRIICAVQSWPSLWTNTSAFKIWSKLDWFTRLKFGTTAFGSVNLSKKTKKHC